LGDHIESSAYASCPAGQSFRISYACCSSRITPCVYTEARQFLRMAGCLESDLAYYWEDLLRAADTNNDGNISRDEFVVYIMGEESLTPAGEFKHRARHDEIAAQVKALGGALPRLKNKPGPSTISEGVPPSRHDKWPTAPSYGINLLVETIANSLGRHGAVLSVAEPACLALWNYAFKNENGLVVESISNTTGLIHAVSSAMLQHSSSTTIQEAGCGVFWAVTHESSVARGQVVGEGGLAATIAAMNGGNAEESVMEAACATIGNLAMENYLSDALIGLETNVAQAMAAFPGSERVHVVACAALRNLSSR